MNTRGLILIIIGAMFECAWAFGLKHAQGPFEIFLTVVCVVASFGIFMLSFKYVGASIAYVVYTGLGTLFVVLVEMADTLSHGGQPEILRIVFVVTLLNAAVVRRPGWKDAMPCCQRTSKKWPRRCCVTV